MRRTWRRFAPFALGLISAGSSAAAAAPPDPAPPAAAYEPKIVPKCRVAPMASGETACAYTLEQVKAVLLADAELDALRKKSSEQGAQIQALRAVVVAREREVDGVQAINLRLQQRQDALTAERLQCDRDLRAEQSKPRLGSPIAWTVAAVAVAFGVGAALVAMVR